MGDAADGQRPQDRNLRRRRLLVARVGGRAVSHVTGGRVGRRLARDGFAFGGVGRCRGIGLRGPGCADGREEGGVRAAGIAGGFAVGRPDPQQGVGFGASCQVPAAGSAGSSATWSAWKYCRYCSSVSRCSCTGSSPSWGSVTGVPGAVVMFSAAGNAARVASFAGRTIAMGRSRAAETASASCQACSASTSPAQTRIHGSGSGMSVSPVCWWTSRSSAPRSATTADTWGSGRTRPRGSSVARRVPSPTVMISVWSVHPHVPASRATALPTARTSSAVPSRSSAPVCRRSASSRSPFSVAPRVTSPG